MAVEVCGREGCSLEASNRKKKNMAPVGAPMEFSYGNTLEGAGINLLVL